MTSLIVGALIVALALQTLVLIGAMEGWWAALAERRSRPTPCRYCETRHATDVERRACDDRGLS